MNWIANELLVWLENFIGIVSRDLKSAGNDLKKEKRKKGNEGKKRKSSTVETSAPLRTSGRKHAKLRQENNIMMTT